MPACTTITVWSHDRGHLHEVRQQCILTMLASAGQAIEDPNTTDHLEHTEAGPIVKPSPGLFCFSVYGYAESESAIRVEDFPAVRDAAEAETVVVAWQATTLPG